PSATGVEVLDEDLLGTEQTPEPIIASPIVADGRVYVTSMDETYAIGNRVRAQSAQSAQRAPGAPCAQCAPAVVQVFPYESIISPGQTVALSARLFDAKGNFVRDAPPAQWSVDQLHSAGDP